ncbi:hypothetical protein KY361_02545 [Candidatus Woesearchaeota archaeon]|nr:hypothetical protein [Candidatus Woesearchaeota archaeon]
MGEQATAEATTPYSGRPYSLRSVSVSRDPTPASGLDALSVDADAPFTNWCLGEALDYSLMVRDRHGLPRRHLEIEDLGKAGEMLKSMRATELEGGIVRDELDYFISEAYKRDIEKLVAQQAAKEKKQGSEPESSDGLVAVVR